MEFTALNEFSFLTFLAGGIFLITGLIYKFNPPITMTWYAIQLKTARRSRETFRETVRFAAKPIAFAGLILLIVGFSPIFFFNLNFFNIVLANILILITCILLISLINRHINRIFDEKGNRRDIIT